MGPFGSYVDIFSLQSALGSESAVLASNLLQQLRAARTYPAMPAFHWTHDSLGDYITASTAQDSQWSCNLNDLVTEWVQRAFAEEAACTSLCGGATMTSNGNPASRIDDIITTMQHNANAFNQIVATLTSRRKVLQFLDERLTPHLFYVPVALPAATAAGSPEADPAAGSPAADSLRVCIITDAKFVFCHDARDDSMQRVMVFKVSEFRIAKVQHLSRKQAAVMSEAALNTISQQLEDALGRADALKQNNPPKSTQQLQDALRSIQTLIKTCQDKNSTLNTYCVVMTPPRPPANISQLDDSARYYTEIQRQQPPAELEGKIPSVQAIKKQKILLEPSTLQAVDRVRASDTGAASAGGDLLRWPRTNDGQFSLWMTMDAMMLLESDPRIPNRKRFNWRAAWNVFNAIRAVYAQTLDRMIHSFDLASKMLQAQMLATTRRASTATADRREHAESGSESTVPRHFTVHAGVGQAAAE